MSQEHSNGMGSPSPRDRSAPLRIAINGFGRMGRLFTRASVDRDDLEVVAINEIEGSDEALAILLEFDSVQGRWSYPVSELEGRGLRWKDRDIPRLRNAKPAELPWAELGVDLVVECTGRFRTPASLKPHFEAGAPRVLVSAPVSDGPPNIVVGVNDSEVDFGSEPILSAASCTTNCLAPIVRVLQDGLGIERGMVTTIHDPTNTQRVHDAPHKDPRRARASILSLIPTSTNSAHAVTRVIPELLGKLDSIAVRAPVLNASLTQCAFHVGRDTTVDEVNGLLEAAANSAPLRGILGFETRPLVSVDYARDPRSGVVDALSTRVVDGRLVQVMAWYDNEWGYANRMVELAGSIATAVG